MHRLLLFPWKHMAASLALVLCAQAMASGVSGCDTSRRESGGVTKSRLHATVGDRFSVCLAANQSAGYLWALPFDKSEGLERLIYLGNRYRAGAEAKGQVGVPGSDIFHFAAAQTGTVKLVLEYVRPWLWYEPPAESAVFEITILPKPGNYRGQTTI